MTHPNISPPRSPSTADVQSPVPAGSDAAQVSGLQGALGHLNASIAGGRVSERALVGALAPASRDSSGASPIVLGPRPSGIPINISELKLAAGAGGRGTTHLTSADMCSRYDAALKGLSVNLSPEMKAIIDSAASDVAFMNEVFSKNWLGLDGGAQGLGQLIVDRLKETGRVLIPAPSRGHAMLAEITQEADGSYRLRIYNSGDGLSRNHEADPARNGKYATCAEYKLSALPPEKLDQLLAMGVKKPGEKPGAPRLGANPDDIYIWAFMLDGAEKVKLPPEQIVWQTPQKAADCTLEVVNTFIRDRVAREVAKDPVLSQKEGAFAKSFYREAKAAYLNQVLIDYHEQYGSNADSEPFLEATRVRADQAEVSAGLGGLSRSDSGLLLLESHKAALRGYNSIRDFVHRGASKGSMPYLNQKVDIALDSTASQGDVVIYRATSGPELVFKYDKSTGVLSVGEGNPMGLKNTFSPIWDVNKNLIGITSDKRIGSFFRASQSSYRLDSSSLTGHADLARFLSEQDIARLSQISGDVYLKVNDLGHGLYALDGCVYTDHKAAVVTFRKNSDSSGLEISEPVQASRPAWSGSMTGLNLLMDELGMSVGMTDDPVLGLTLQAHQDSLPEYADPAKVVAEEFQRTEETRRTAQLLMGARRSNERSWDDAAGNEVRSYVEFRDDGSFTTTLLTLPPEGGSLVYERQRLDGAGLITERGQLAFSSSERDAVIDKILQAPGGEVATNVDSKGAWCQRIQKGQDPGTFEIHDSLKRVEGELETRSLSAQSGSSADAPNAQLQAELPALSAAELQDSSLDPSVGPVQVNSEGCEIVLADGSKTASVHTAYHQLQPDGSYRTLVRSQVGQAIEWTIRKTGSDGQTIEEITRTEGSDGRSRRIATVLPDGGVTEVLDERASSQAALGDPDHAYSHTERTQRPHPDGSTTVIEDVWYGDTEANASGMGSPSGSEHKEITSTLETGPDGIQRQREKATSRILQNGKLTTIETEQVTSLGQAGKVVESLSSQVTTASGLTVKSETLQGETTEYVKQGESFVSADQAGQSAEVEQALAMQDLARSAVVSNVASEEGIEAVSPLLAKQGTLSDDTTHRQAQLEGLLQSRATGSMSRAVASGAVGVGASVFAIYQGVMGVYALRAGIKSGNLYMVGMGSVGIGAGAAQVAELGLQGASLMATSSRALAALGKVASVAGRVSLALGVVAMGMMVPGLVDAIKRGDTKAIVSNAVGLGGGAAAMAAGMTVGGLPGAGIGLVLGGLVMGFVELFNHLFNPGTPISGPDPLKAMSVEDRTRTLQAAQTLLANWDGDALNEGRLKDLAESAPNENVKAAAKFFVDHPVLMQWMDASNAGGADLEKRDARYDGNISKSDVNRYIGYMAVPPALYQTLPPPSKEARLWVLSIIDPQTHEEVVDAFGKDGEGQGSGDGIAALAEYANMASGTFDDRTRELLKNRYPAESDPQIEQRLQTLKKACAYLAAYPSELRALESFKVSARETYQIKPGERSDDGTQVVWRLADDSELSVDTNRLHNDLSKDIFQRLMNGELITEDELLYLESEEGSDDIFEGDDWDTWMKFTQSQGRSTMPPKRAIPGRDSGVAEDGRVGTDDIEAMRASYQSRIDDLLAQFPGGLPSFNDTAETNRAMGDENPALWRPDRFGNPNPDRPQSYEQVLLNHADEIDANSDGTLDWQEMADARERALHDRQYSLYFSLDYVLRNGANLFTDRGAGMDLKINKADLALRAG